MLSPTAARRSAVWPQHAGGLHREAGTSHAAATQLGTSPLPRLPTHPQAVAMAAAGLVAASLVALVAAGVAAVVVAVAAVAVAAVAVAVSGRGGLHPAVPPVRGRLAPS